MTIPDEQSEAAAFLTRLAGTPSRETHISAVFIGDDTVWKLKKAIALSFLDFTTLEARHHFLCRERDLNKPAAPEIYRDVVAITRGQDGKLVLGEGDPLDWVLRMARVPDADFLDPIVATGRLTEALLDALGDCVFDYHARLPPVADWDSVASMHRIADGNAQAAIAAGLAEDRVCAWHDGLRREIEAQADRLTQRSKAGFVRRCHGDLHLGNLCLWNGKPVAFDALEFDEALATIDVAYDLAFLLMDLDLKAGRPAANRVLNRYLGRSGDTGLAALLRLFMSQRALIRAHVRQAQDDSAGGSRHLDAASAYLRPADQQVIAIGGLQGSGKTTLARKLAPHIGSSPGAVIIRSDETRKRLFHQRPEDRLPPDAYSDQANARVNATVIALAMETAATGHAVIVDSTFLEMTLRSTLETSCRSTAIPFTGIWLTAPLPVLEQRIRSRSNDASDATVAVLHKAAARGIDAGDWHSVDAVDSDHALQRISALMAGP
jgi:uncharacterized protein